nr:PREDICTED: uncharacterized protein LOC108200190 isoform X2 [Daucus carota subsp. sativus]
MKSSEYSVPDGSKSSVYKFWGDEGRDIGKVKCQNPYTWTPGGFSIDNDSLNCRLMILAVCTFVSLIVGVATRGWPSVVQYGLEIVLSFLLVVFGTAIKRHVQFRHFEKELLIHDPKTVKFLDVKEIWPSTTNVSQALKVTRLELLAGLAFVSLIRSLATGEWLSGDLDGHGLEIVLAILLVVMIEKFWMGSFLSTLVAINKLLIACYPISFCAIVTNAQLSNSALEGDYTLQNFSRNDDEHHPLMLSVKKNWVQGTSILDWTDIIMFIGIMLLAVTLYYHNWVLSAFCILWTHIIDLMQALKIKMKQGLVKVVDTNGKFAW